MKLRHMFLAFGKLFNTFDKKDINKICFYECPFLSFEHILRIFKFLSILEISKNYLLVTFSNVCCEIE